EPLPEHRGHGAAPGHGPGGGPDRGRRADRRHTGRGCRGPGRSMMTETTIDLTTHTLDVPGAVLTYDVRPNESSSHPVLLMIGSPMGAAGFGALAAHFTDRSVVTYDPRMSDRSKRTDGALLTTVEEQADDLHR